MAADQSDIDNEDARDGQDVAEVFDEDNLDSDSARLAKDDEELNFDNMPDVFDSTSAVGDEEDDDGPIGDDLSDSEIVELSRQAIDESDEDEGEEEDDAYRASEDLEDDDDEDSDEVELSYAGDLNTVAGAHSGAQRYESKNLSDEDLEELGYKKIEADAKHEDEQLDSGLEETFPASDPVSVKHIT
jgi:hypothetical protein